MNHLKIINQRTGVREWSDFVRLLESVVNGCCVGLRTVA